MPTPELRIPEPTLPEHALIRDSAPVPELSAGLKSKVMAECSATIAHARRVWRLKVAGTVSAVCALGLVVALNIPAEPQTAQSDVADQNEPETRSYSSNHQLAGDSNAPPPGPDAETRQMKQLMEDLQGRNQMLDANIIPKF